MPPTTDLRRRSGLLLVLGAGLFVLGAWSGATPVERSVEADAAVVLLVGPAPLAPVAARHRARARRRAGTSGRTTLPRPAAAVAAARPTAWAASGTRAPPSRPS